MGVDTSIWLVLLAFGVLVVILLGAWRLSLIQQARRGEEPASYVEQMAGIEPEPEERLASAAAERIEFLVRQRLAGHADLAEVPIDFGTQPDGSLAIWVDGEKYTDPETIPDERIRDAVRAAVEDFNEAGA